jgi:flagellar basal body-associated protein FliL
MKPRYVILPLIIVTIILGAAVFSLTMLNKNTPTPANNTTNPTNLNSSNDTNQTTTIPEIQPLKLQVNQNS